MYNCATFVKMAQVKKHCIGVNKVNIRHNEPKSHRGDTTSPRFRGAGGFFIRPWGTIDTRRCGYDGGRCFLFVFLCAVGYLPDIWNVSP